MQSGYGGGGGEMQHFLVDGCAPASLFSISPSQPPNPNFHPASTALHHHHHHHHPHQQPPPPQAPQFSHFHPVPIPITQQLFAHHPHHHFQLFHPHPQLGLDQESGPENSASPARMMGGGGAGGGGTGCQPFLASAMNFKLAVNESSGGGSRDGLDDDGGGGGGGTGGSILQGDDGSESRLHHHHHHPWSREDDSSAIKEPFWRPLDIDYINRNNKRCKEKQHPPPETSSGVVDKYTAAKKSKLEALGDVQSQQGNATGGSNYKLFSELEAIYKPGGSGTCLNAATTGGGGNNQAGSGSALTGDETTLPTATAPTGVDQPADPGSDNSAGGEAPPAKKFQKTSGGSAGRRKRKRRQQQQRQLSSIAAFFESLVKQLMDHQEALHRKFLEVMERRDQERTSREEAWRKQEAAKSAREAAARAQDRALAAAREAAIISFLEKITGETLALPTNLPSSLDLETLKDANDDTQEQNPSSAALVEHYDPFGGNAGSGKVQMMTSRWPKAEVQALIRVRSGLEARFQEPGLKGPLWEEVSSAMATMGYSRSAKRCKEKWENINKYFRKTKDSGKKRPQHSKTCPYFHQLDQLYSKSKSSTPSSAPPPSSTSDHNGGSETEEMVRKDSSTNASNNSELLDAIVVAGDHQSYKYPAETGHLSVGNEEEEEEEGEEEGEREGHGESQVVGQEMEGGGEEQPLSPDEDSTTLFFQRLHS